MQERIQKEKARRDKIEWMKQRELKRLMKQEQGGDAEDDLSSSDVFYPEGPKEKITVIPVQDDKDFLKELKKIPRSQDEQLHFHNTMLSAIERHEQSIQDTQRLKLAQI